MAYDCVVRDGTIVTASDIFDSDVGISDGRIVAVGASLGRADQEIDAGGLQVLPGGLDVHTHLDAVVGGLTTVDDFESGTAAAACGGITTICDYAWQQRGQTLSGTIDAWKAKARNKAHIDYSFHVVLSEDSDERLAELAPLVAAGYTSFKVFMIREFGIGDAGMLRLFRAAKACGAVVNVHAENGEMIEDICAHLLQCGKRDPRYYAESRPALAEAEATRRAIDFAEITGATIYIVHLSCRGALEAVQAARARGLPVWAETRPIYLVLTDQRYEPGGVEAAKVVAAPPLRSADDREALWQGLRSGSLQAIGSDNTSWTPAQKAAGTSDFTRVPYGVPGLETEMTVIYSEGVSKGRISANTFVAAFSTNPARIFGFYPRKGTIAAGTDADLVLFDPKRTMTLNEARLHSRSGYDPFHGFQVTGVPVLTMSHGEVIAREGQLMSRPGRGRLLPRRPVPFF